jgi:hypothetical protein
MKYKELQIRLKQYQAAALSQMKLNSKKNSLEIEYQRCLQLKLSQTELERIVTTLNNSQLSAIKAFEMYTHSEKFSLPIIKSKTYELARVNNLQEFKLAFPIIKDQNFDFRTKKAWTECVYLVDLLTKESQKFDKFQQDVANLVNSIQQQHYYQLRGEAAAEEAYEDLDNYICFWKGAQWEFNLSIGVSTLDRLKRTWLEKYLSRHNLEQLLNYSSTANNEL